MMQRVKRDSAQSNEAPRVSLQYGIHKLCTEKQATFHPFIMYTVDHFSWGHHQCQLNCFSYTLKYMQVQPNKPYAKKNSKSSQIQIIK